MNCTKANEMKFTANPMPEQRSTPCQRDFETTFRRSCRSTTTWKTRLGRQCLPAFENSVHLTKRFTLFLAICFVIQGQILGGEEEHAGLPGDARLALEHTASVMSSSHIEFDVAKSGHIPKSYYDPDNHTVIFDAGRFRHQTRLRQRFDGVVTKMVQEDAFDGKTFYMGEPEIPVGDIPAVLFKYAIGDESEPERHSRRVSMQYLVDTGFHVPQSIAELGKPAFDSLVLHSISESTSTRIEKVNDKLRVTVTVPDADLLSLSRIKRDSHRKRLMSANNSAEYIEREMEALDRIDRLEPRRTIAFVLDPKYDFGIIEREEWASDGQRIMKMVATNWKNYTPQNVWLPSNCIETYYTYPSAPTKFFEMPWATFQVSLTKAEFGPQNDVEFALNYTKPGTEIIDRSSEKAKSKPNHQVSYVIPADPTRLRQAAESASGTYDSAKKFRWIIALNLAVFAVVGIVVVVRRRRAS